MSPRNGGLSGIPGHFTPLVTRRSIALLPPGAMLNGFLLITMLEMT